MKYLNKGVDCFKLNIGESLLCLIAITIPFMVNIGNLFIITSVIYGVYILIKRKISFNSYVKFEFWFPAIFFCIVTASALTSNNLDDGYRAIDKKILMLLIPFVICSFWRIKINYRKVLLSFAVSTTIASAILLTYGLIRLLIGNPIEVMFFHEYTLLYDQHPVYFALFIALSIFIITDEIFRDSFGKRYRLILMIGLLFVSLIFTASKAILFIFCFLYISQLIYLLPFFRQRMIVIVSFSVVCIVSLTVPIIQNRFVEGLEFDIKEFNPTNQVSEARIFTSEEKYQISDLELRYILNKIAIFHTVDDDNYLFGYGVGDIQDYLDYYYMYYGLAPSWYEGFNLHNQYLQIFMSMGIIVLLFFLFYLGYSLYYSLKTHNILYLLFLAMVIFAFLFESYMSRNKGIVFFIFFNTLFLLQSKNYENSDIRN